MIINLHVVVNYAAALIHQFPSHVGSELTLESRIVLLQNNAHTHIQQSCVLSLAHTSGTTPNGTKTFHGSSDLGVVYLVTTQMKQLASYAKMT
jgi:hypothetical protein